MIRRSPTRIELKLDDLHDFEYISKIEKKKSTNTSTLQQQEKVARHERIVGPGAGGVGGPHHGPVRTAHAGAGGVGRGAIAAAAAIQALSGGGAGSVPTTPAAAAGSSN